MLQIPSLVTPPPVCCHRSPYCRLFSSGAKKPAHIYTCTVYANTTYPLNDSPWEELGIQDGSFYFCFCDEQIFQINFIVSVEIFNDCSCIGISH